MRIGRAIAAGTMAMGAYRASKEFKGHDEQGRRGSTRSRSRGRHQQQKRGWFGTPFSIRH